MQTSFPLGVYRTDLARIVEEVFQAMMDIRVQPAEAPWTNDTDTLTAAVYLTGEWRGGVLVECKAQQACQFTHRLMGIAMPTAIDDDVRDTMGEIANMLAGNLKSLLPGGVGLSMPSVVAGTDYSLRVCGGNAVERVPFTSSIGSFCIVLIEMLDKD